MGELALLRGIWECVHPLLEVVTLNRVGPDSDRPRLLISVQASPAGTIMKLIGQLDMATTVLLAGELERVYERPEPPKVILDLSGLDFCDSSGVGSLVAVWRRIQEAGGGLALIGVHGMCRHILRITGLDKVLSMYGTLAEARTALGGSSARPEDDLSGQG